MPTLPIAEMTGLALAGLLVACSSSSTTPSPEPDARGETRDGVEPRFAWRPAEYRLRRSSRTVLADGTTTESSSQSQRMVVREEGGHLVVTFPGLAPGPDPDGFDIALANAYGALRLELRADGQIDRITGFDAFVESVAGSPGVEMSRADLEATRKVVEGTFEQEYVQWVVTWLDLGVIPRPGAPIDQRSEDVTIRVSSVDASELGAGKLRARFSIAGPVLRTTQTEMQAHLLYGELIAGEMEPLFASASGYWHVEVVTDPRDLIPIVATIETRLTASAGERTLTASASHTTELVPVVETTELVPATR